LQPAAAHDPANGVQACSQYRCYQWVIAYQEAQAVTH
jgi:hypothetical protein